MIIIDTFTSKTHFILSYEDGTPIVWISKKSNTLEMVIEQVGKENVKEVR